MQNAMDEKQPNFPPCGVTHFLGLEARLGNIDRDIPFPEECVSVPECDDICITIHAAKPAVEPLDPARVREIQSQLYRTADFFPGQDKRRKRREIVFRILAGLDGRRF